MKSFLKYIGIHLIITFIMTSIGLEMDFEIIKYLLIYGTVAIGFFFFLKYFNFYGLTRIGVFFAISISIFSTYILSASIIMHETSLAYSKIKSIPKEDLTEFYRTKDINAIPEDKRRAWIGLFYREINIIPEHSERKIKAVGWKIDSIFAYYNLDKDDYTGSYH